MKAYRASCDDCGLTATRPTRAGAVQALQGHACLHRCGMCGLLFPLLVDGALCIPCDALLFPAISTRRIA